MGGRWAAPGALLIVGACAQTRVAEIPALNEAPQSVAALALDVDARVEVRSTRWARKGLDRAIAAAIDRELKDALRKSGCEVRSQDPDLVARVTARLSGSMDDLISTTELELLQDGRLIDRIQLQTPQVGTRLPAELYPELIAVKLANLVASSPHVAAMPRRQRITVAVDEPPPARPPIVCAFDLVDTAQLLDDRALGQLSQYVGTRVAQVMRYRIVPRDRLRELLLQQKRDAFAPCVDQACQIELGKALAAEKIFATELLRVGSTCALTATLFDLRTETAERAASVKTTCGSDALIAGIDRLVAELGE